MTDSMNLLQDPLWLVVGFIVLVFVLHIARHPVHSGIRAFSRVLHGFFRAAAKSVMQAENRLVERNREVLLASGREEKERYIEREFERVQQTVKKELSEYPALHLEISQQVDAIKREYHDSQHTAPLPSGWSSAVSSIANIPTKNDPIIADVLDTIHKSMIKAEDKALNEYRRISSERHAELKKIQPHLSKITSVINQVEKNVASLHERSRIIDRHMDEYENIQQATDRAVHTLSTSAITNFFISALVLVIAVFGALINFNLIARPMAEMVGGMNTVGNFKIADISALVIILVEISMGLFLMESLRITRLFPVISALNDQLRVRMIWITLTILTFLASIEAGLAFMREMLMQEDLATTALLRGEAAVASEMGASEIITMTAQMGLGFILPFALTFVAIPLETFIQSTRIVLGSLFAVCLRGLAMSLRLVGNICQHLGSLLVSLFDILIFMPLWLFSTMDKMKNSSTKQDPQIQEHQ